MGCTCGLDNDNGLNCHNNGLAIKLPYSYHITITICMWPCNYQGFPESETGSLVDSCFSCNNEISCNFAATSTAQRGLGEMMQQWRQKQRPSWMHIGPSCDTLSTHCIHTASHTYGTGSLIQILTAHAAMHPDHAPNVVRDSNPDQDPK